jgi:hypothetical protein
VRGIGQTVAAKNDPVFESLVPIAAEIAEAERATTQTEPTEADILRRLALISLRPLDPKFQADLVLMRNLQIARNRKEQEDAFVAQVLSQMAESFRASDVAEGISSPVSLTLLEQSTPNPTRAAETTPQDYPSATSDTSPI